MKKKFLFLLSLSVCISLLWVNVAFALFTITPGPAYSAEFGRSGEFKYQVEPGETVDLDLMVKNRGDESVTLEFRAADAFREPGGAFVLRGYPAKQMGFGTWVDVEKTVEDLSLTGAEINDNGSFTLGPREQFVLPARFTVPENVAPGPYFGSFLVAAAPDETTLEASGSKIKTAVGVRVNINVVGEEIYDIGWTEFSQFISEEGIRAFGFQYSNDGNMVVDMNIDFSIKSLFGNTVFEADKKMQVVPEIGGEINIEWLELPYIGFFKVKADSSYTKSDLFGGVDDSQEPVDLGSKELSVLIVPWLHVGIFMLFVLCVLFFVMRRHKHHKEFVATLVQYKVKKGDTLFELASKRGVDWKLLAKVNKIKAPYPLLSGQTILLPKAHK